VIIFAGVACGARANPDLFCMGRREPAGWMKYSNSMLAEHAAGEYSGVRAILAEICGRVRSGGVKVRALTTQNELDADQAGECRRVHGRRRMRSAGGRAGPLLEASGQRFGRWTTITICGGARWISSQGRGSKICEHRGVARYVGSPEMMGYVKQNFRMWRCIGPKRGRLPCGGLLTKWSKWGATFSGFW